MRIVATFLSKGFFNRPMSARYSVIEGVTRDVQYFSPLSNVQCLVVESYKMVVAFIIRLFFARGPLAICRFVIAVIIHSLQSHSGGWRLSHVAQQISYGTLPVVANFNSTTTISFISVMFRIVATSDHSIPNPKNTSIPKTMICCETVSSWIDCRWISHAVRLA